MTERFIRIPASTVAHARTRKLSGLQYELWLYLCELDPFGDRWVDIPAPSEIATVLHCDTRTVERAARRLQDCDLFDFQIETWKAKNTAPLSVVEENSPGKGIQKSAIRSKSRQMDPKVGNGIKRSKSRQMDPNAEIKAPLGAGFRNGNVPITDQTLLTKQIGTSTKAEAQSAINSEGIGTGAEPLTTELLALISEFGLRPNQTIQTALAELQQRADGPAARRAVENALSALAEQNKVGVVRNPGGFFVAALRRGFTSNQGKRQRRERGEVIKAPDVMQIEYQIDHYIVKEKRPDWALAKLQELWEQGWHDAIKHLVFSRKDWGFSITDEGVTANEGNTHS